MIPGEALIYTRADGVLYAQYRDPPHNNIPRWVIGGDPGGVARAQGELFDYLEWQDLCKLSMSNPTLKKLMDKLINTYYIAKEENQ